MLKYTLVSATLAIVSLLSVASEAQNSERARKPLARSCFDRTFLSISVRNPKADAFPAIALEITDPAGRTLSAGRNAKRVPLSQYGRVYEVGESPDKSKALAAEICKPMQGDYDIGLLELSSGSEYSLSVRAHDEKGANTSLILLKVNSKSRHCHYKLRFKLEYDDVFLYWLDESGATTSSPQCLRTK